MMLYLIFPDFYGFCIGSEVDLLFLLFHLMMVQTHVSVILHKKVSCILGRTKKFLVSLTSSSLIISLLDSWGEYFVLLSSLSLSGKGSHARLSRSSNFCSLNSLQEREEARIPFPRY